MRIFITSYQKAGTHQIAPAMEIYADIEDRSYADISQIHGYGVAKQIDKDGLEYTCEKLRKFKDKKFGHIPYTPEYAEAIQHHPTKVLFNVRDPRDVVVANYHNIHKKWYGGTGHGHLNFKHESGKMLIEMDDPITELIKIEAVRWPAWLGWLDHDFTMQVKYEDLRTNGLETLEKIEEFVKPNSVNYLTTYSNLYPKPENPTFRAGRIGDWKTEFNSFHKELAERLLGKTIERLGYEI